MTNENLLSKDTQQVIKKYSVLYSIVFKYSVLLLPFIGGIAMAYTMQSKESLPTVIDTTNLTPASYTIVEGIYKATRVSDEVGSIYAGRGNIVLLGGELQATGDVLIGRNNMITFGNIMLPDKPYLIDFDFSGDLNTFATKNYNVEDLQRVLNKRVLSLPPTSVTQIDEAPSIIDSMFLPTQTTIGIPTNMEELLKILESRGFFAGPYGPNANKEGQKKSLIQEYNLQCMFNVRLYDGFCNKNIENFIKKIPELTLDDIWDDIFTIANAVKKTSHVEALCSNVMYNIMKQPYPSEELDSLMNGVCNKFNTRYSKIKDFLRVENQIKSIPTDEVINNNMDVNLFKLVSLQQKIMMQDRDKTVDTSIITTYLRFLDELIHQNQKNMQVPQFYIEASYFFNNAYLQNILIRLNSISLNPTTKTDVSNIRDHIGSINKGNEAIGVRGLDSMIKNEDLKAKVSSYTAKNVYGPTQNFEQGFTDYLKGYPTLSVTKVLTEETTSSAHLEGTYKYAGNENTTGNIKLIIQFSYEDNAFTPEVVRVPENPTLDNLVSKLLNTNPGLPLSTILEFIENNGDYVPTTITICDILGGQGISVKECGTSTATFTVNTATISVNIRNNTITSAQTTDQKVQLYIDNLIQQYSAIGIDRLPNTISGIKSLTTKSTEGEEAIGSIDVQKLSIISKFKTFLGVEPSNIVQNNQKKWIAVFTLKGYEFATVVDIEKNYKLAPLVTQANDAIITCSNFSLTLIPFSQTRITQFVDDPMGYIRQVDSACYNEYTRLGGSN